MIQGKRGGILGSWGKRTGRQSEEVAKGTGHHKEMSRSWQLYLVDMVRAVHPNYKRRGPEVPAVSDYSLWWISGVSE